MLLKTEHQVKLGQKYQKILHFCPAFNDTYVMLAIKHHLTQVLVHLEASGKVIKQRVFYDSDLDQFSMINDRQVIILHTKSNLIIQWNLQTNALIQVPFLYADQEIIQTCELFLFPQSQYICIVQLGNTENNLFKLSYFRYPFQYEHQQPFQVFEQEQVWDFNYIVRRGNNSSMVCWVKIQLQTEPLIKTFHINSNNQGVFKAYDLTLCKTWAQTFSQLEISVGNIWQIRPLEFLMIGITNEPYSDQEETYPNTNLIFNGTKKTIRRSLFNFPGKYQNQHIDCMFFGNTSMFRCYEFEKGVPIETPVYYIDNVTEQITIQQQWRCSHLTKYELLGHLPNTLIQCQYENGHVEQVKVMAKEIIQRKTLVTFIVDRMIPNCSYDLALGVINLIEEYQ